MARINTVQKARKDQGRCYTCREHITAGQSYQWQKANRFAPRYAWHSACSQPRPSVLEANEKTAAILAAQENAEDALDAVKEPSTYADAEEALSEVVRLLEDCASEVRDAAELYRESAQNIEDGFGHETEQSMELNDKADQVEQSADELESADLEEFEGEEDDELDQDELAQWWQDTISAASEAINNIEIP